MISTAAIIILAFAIILLIISIILLVMGHNPSALDSSSQIQTKNTQKILGWILLGISLFMIIVGFSIIYIDRQHIKKLAQIQDIPMQGQVMSPQIVIQPQYVQPII